MARRRPYLFGMVCVMVMNCSRRSKVSLTAGEFSCSKMSMAGSVEVLEVVGVAWDDFLVVLGLSYWRCGFSLVSFPKVDFRWSRGHSFGVA
ncbi:hypothetical protein TNIN_142531 [Trichonephila inaurata madagascariensis]|uniref:Uncharacterized protein n=1 Tax=Trichonephila inaurata madagascariensis TaxID=2747483 RepID=A0A8X6JU87_9ARAC|nr:hypothetical protein TNIN_142531 [Trichonephila inaurata madagascariensis]